MLLLSKWVLFKYKVSIIKWDLVVDLVKVDKCFEWEILILYISLIYHLLMVSFKRVDFIAIVFDNNFIVFWIFIFREKYIDSWFVKKFSDFKNIFFFLVSIKNVIFNYKIF